MRRDLNLTAAITWPLFGAGGFALRWWLDRATRRRP